jgi:hypothetical protein
MLQGLRTFDPKYHFYRPDSVPKISRGYCPFLGLSEFGVLTRARSSRLAYTRCIAAFPSSLAIRTQTTLIGEACSVIVRGGLVT